MAEKPADKSLVNTGLEQFVLLAKTAKGAAAVELIKQVLEANGVYVFHELLDMPNIKELENGPFNAYYELLKVFAYGTYKTYLQKKDNLPELTELQKQKLKHLTIVSLAARNNTIPYPLLLEETDSKSVREMEDVIIEVIYNEAIKGKLNQNESHLEVSFAIARDFQRQDLNMMIETLQAWYDQSETVLSDIDEQIAKANSEKAAQKAQKLEIENEIANVKNQLKMQMAEDDLIDKNDVLNIMIDKGAKKANRPIKKPTKSSEEKL